MLEVVSINHGPPILGGQDAEAKHLGPGYHGAGDHQMNIENWWDWDMQHPKKDPKTKIAPEKWCLGDYFPFGKAYFQGLCLLWGGYLWVTSPCKTFRFWIFVPSAGEWKWFDNHGRPGQYHRPCTGHVVVLKTCVHLATLDGLERHPSCVAMWCISPFRWTGWYNPGWDTEWWKVWELFQDVEVVGNVL